MTTPKKSDKYIIARLQGSTHEEAIQAAGYLSQPPGKIYACLRKATTLLQEANTWGVGGWRSIDELQDAYEDRMNELQLEREAIDAEYARLEESMRAFDLLRKAKNKPRKS